MDNKWSDIKNKLISERDEIIKKSNKVIDVDGQGDEIDEIQAKQLLSINKTLSSFKVDKINKMNEAIEKIDKGLYGMCEDCGDPINPKRLAINPCSTTCVFCAEIRERG